MLKGARRNLRALSILVPLDILLPAGKKILRHLKCIYSKTAAHRFIIYLYPAVLKIRFTYESKKTYRLNFKLELQKTRTWQSNNICAKAPYNIPYIIFALLAKFR